MRTGRSSAASEACSFIVTITATSRRRIEMCPRVIAGRRREPTILKCCLLEFDIERDGEMMIVPWGADLPMVERALRALSRSGEAGS